MATKARRRTTAAIAATVLAGAMAVWASPAQAAATGVIAGHVTTSAGAPAADITVYLNDADSYEFMGQATTAADGSYSVGGLATNSYIVGFVGEGIADQYFDGKTRIFDADPVQVTTGQTTTVNEDLLPTGYIEGKILDTTGAPFDFMYVQPTGADGLPLTGAPTDSDGNYRIALPVGSYYLAFNPIPDSYQEQYIPGQLSSDTATLFTVTAGAVTRADDRALPTGTISGRLTNSDGTPAADASVFFSVFKASGTGVSATTNSNGEFTTSPPLLVGPYMVEFWLGDRGQYYKSTANYDDADPVTVTAGRDTHIEDSLLPTGDVRVRAYDAVSGAGIRDFCAGSGYCSGGTGQVLVPNLYAGPQQIDVYTDSNYLDRAGDVNVRANATTDVTVRLLPAAHITTTVLDKATGKPLSGVCLTAYQLGKVGYREGFSDAECSDATGKVTVNKLEAGPHRLFAEPHNNVYGRQWVGANGGTGDERAAVTVNAVRGKTVTGPTVRIDRSGSIRGRITDAATGDPLSAGVGIFTQNPGLGGGETQSDDDGRYQIDGLGPYTWPLVFMRRGAWADAWTGGAVSRYASTGTPVTAGGMATADIALTHGVTVRGTVVTDTGTPVSSGRINILNTETGDYTGTVDFDGENYEVHLLPGQEIMLRYDIQVNGKRYQSDKAALPPATPGGAPRYSVAVPAGGLTLDLVVKTS